MKKILLTIFCIVIFPLSSFSATIKDAFGNDATGSFSLNGDASGITVDGGASGDGKKEKWADLVSSAAGGGLSATNGVLSVQGNSSTQASSGTPLSEGYNYTTGSAGGAFLLPVNATVGDVVTLKIGAADGGKVTLSRQAAHTIDSTLSSVSLDSAHAAVTLVYMVSGSWKIV